MKCNNYKKILADINEPIATVLGCYVTGLAVIRNLGRKKIPVVGLDPNPLQIGFFSKYCKGVECPDPQRQKKEFIKFLLEFGEELNEKAVLIPSADQYSLEILKNRKQLEKYYRFIMADEDISLKLINKLKFYETLEKYEIDYPKIYYPKDFDEIDEIINNIKFPCYIKPIYSCYFKKDFQAKMFIAKSCKELLFFYKKAKFRNHDVMIQECIPGAAENTYCLNAYFNKDFEPMGICTYKRIREWPPMRGCSCLIEKTSNSKLIEITSYLMKNIGYYGIIDAEFKKDPRDNKLKLIEINARSWMQIGLSAKCGIDHCYMAYMDSIGKDINLEMDDSNYTKWICLYDDLKASIIGAINNELTFKKWIKSFKGKKEYAFYSKDDMLPFLVLYSKSIFTPIHHFNRLIKIKKDD